MLALLEPRTADNEYNKESAEVKSAHFNQHACTHIKSISGSTLLLVSIRLESFNE